MKLGKLIAPYKIADHPKFKLSDIDPGDTGRLDASKPELQVLLTEAVERLSDLQEKLYAQDRWAVLAIFQAMDAAGKDGAIKHVMSGINPQGCEVFSFKVPSVEDLNHDFLWRATRRLPERGRIGIFNRSYYEDVLVVRVHPEILAAQRIPEALKTKKIWTERYQDINALERYLTRNGIVVLKFFLHISKDEQRSRFYQRLDAPEKNWKFSGGDIEERAYWDDYAQAFQEMIRHTATQRAPWYVIPADHKAFARLIVASAMVNEMDRLKLTYPEVNDETRTRLAAARHALDAEAR